MSKETKANNTSRVMSSYGGGLEANTLAMLDSTGAKDNRDANEDRTFSQFFNLRLRLWQSPLFLLLYWSVKWNPRFAVSGSCSCCFTCTQKWNSSNQVKKKALFFKKFSKESWFWYGFCLIWSKMYQAIFRILRFGKTLELITASFQLLTQLHQVLVANFGSFCLKTCVSFNV